MRTGRVLGAWFGLAAGTLLAGPAQVGAPAPLAQVGLPSPEEARSIVARFRDAGFAGAGSCYLEFNLRQMPRRGDERVLPGALWAGRDESGPVLRIALRDGSGRFLVRGGAHPQFWRFEAGTGARQADALAPLVPGVSLTAFDLQMPFLYWPDLKAASVTRILGRPANGFAFHPPADFAQAHPDVAGVLAYLDAQFNAPVQIGLIGKDGVPLRTLSLVDLKRVSDRWIVKEVDVRDERTRDKTRVEVTGAALGLDLSPALFDPARLGDAIAAPPGVAHFGS